MSAGEQAVETAAPAKVKAGFYRWYVLGVLTASQTCHFLDRTVLSVVLEPIRHEFGLSDGQLGLLAGMVYGVAFAAAGIPLGLLVDRVNRRLLLTCVLTAWSGLTAVCGLAQSYLQLVFGRAAVGAAEAGGSPTSLSMLSDYFPRRERATAIGIWYMSSALGVTITYLLGGYVAQEYGWRAAFFVAGIPGLGVAALLLLTVREPRRGACEPEPGPAEKAAPDKAPSMRVVAGYVGRQPAILHLVTGMVICSMTVSATSVWLMSFLIRQHDLELAKSALVSAVAVGFFGAMGALSSGIVGDRIGKVKQDRLALVAAFTTFMSVLFGLAALLTPFTPTVIGLVFVYSFFKSAYNGPANALLVTSVQPRMRGLVISSYQIMTAVIGYGLAPLIVGVLSDLIGGPSSLGTALTIVLLLNIWATVHFLLAARRGRKAFEANRTDPAGAEIVRRR